MLKNAIGETANFILWLYGGQNRLPDTVAEAKREAINSEKLNFPVIYELYIKYNSVSDVMPTRRLSLLLKMPILSRLCTEILTFCRMYAII